MMSYELHPYSEDGKALPVQFVNGLRTTGAAIARAGTLAKRNKGPVDIAHHSDAAWDDRYITTVAPSEYHAKGWRTERLR